MPLLRRWRPLVAALAGLVASAAGLRPDAWASQQAIGSAALPEENATSSLLAVGQGQGSDAFAPRNGLAQWNTKMSIMVDPETMKKKYQQKVPGLIPDGETLLYVLKGGAGNTFLTHDHVVVRDKSNEKTAYLSFPWTSCKAFTFAVQGSGSKSDLMKAHIQLWTSVSSKPVVSRAFRRGADMRTGFVLELWSKVTEQVLGTTITLAGALGRLYEDIFIWMALAQDQPEAQETHYWFTEVAPALGNTESVLLACRSGPGLLVMTSHRLMVVETQLAVKYIEYISIPWTSVRAFTFRSYEGRWKESLVQLQVWTDAPGLGILQRDLDPAKVNIPAIAALLSDKVLDDIADRQEAADVKTVNLDPYLFTAWVYSKYRETETQAVEAMVRAQAGILQDGERIELYFPASSRKVLFTQRRILLIEPQHPKRDRQVAYLSLPYSRIQFFSVEPGSKTRQASALTLGVESMKVETQKHVWHQPVLTLSVSHEEEQEQATTILASAHNLLSQRLYGKGPEDGFSTSLFSFEEFEKWLKSVKKDKDGRDVANVLGSKGILLPGESVEFFSTEGDRVSLLTSKRALILRLIRVGTSLDSAGGRIAVGSMGYSAMQAFSLVVAPPDTLSISFHRPAGFEFMELGVGAQARGMAAKAMKVLYDSVVLRGGELRGSQSLGHTVGAGPDGDALFGQVEKELRDKLGILQDMEEVRMAFQDKDGYLALTNTRLLSKKFTENGLVKYTSMSYSACQAVETEHGSLLENINKLSFWTGQEVDPVFAKTDVRDNLKAKLLDRLARDIA